MSGGNATLAKITQIAPTAPATPANPENAKPLVLSSGQAYWPVKNNASGNTTPITLGGPTGAPPPTGTLHVTGTGANATTNRAFTLNAGGGNLSYVDTLTINNTITGSIVGVGAARRVSAVRWNVASSIVYAWVITIPASAIVAAATYWAVLLLR